MDAVRRDPSARFESIGSIAKKSRTQLCTDSRQRGGDREAVDRSRGRGTSARSIERGVRGEARASASRSAAARSRAPRRRADRDADALLRAPYPALRKKKPQRGRAVDAPRDGADAMRRRERARRDRRREDVDIASSRGGRRARVARAATRASPADARLRHHRVLLARSAIFSASKSRETHLGADDEGAKLASLRRGRGDARGAAGERGGHGNGHGGHCDGDVCAGMRRPRAGSRVPGIVSARRRIGVGQSARSLERNRVIDVVSVKIGSSQKPAIKRDRRRVLYSRSTRARFRSTTRQYHFRPVLLL